MSQSQLVTIQAYINAIKDVLDVVLCIRDFPSEIVEKDNKPEVELQGYSTKTRNLVMFPIYLARSEKEKCLIEPSINSVRVSFTIKANDELDSLIADKFSRYMAVRADQFEILRRKPLKGYDVSFLITNSHLQKYDKDGIIKFIIDYVQTIDKDLSEIKLNIISQTRIAASCFVNGIAQG